MKKTVAILLLILSLSLLFTGCTFSISVKSDKTFTKDGMNITLNTSFSEMEQEGYNAAYASENILILALKEAYVPGIFDADTTLEEYANLVIKNNGMSVKPEKVEDLTTFHFDSTVENVEYSYFACVYKAEDSFWLIQFASQKKDYESLHSEMVEYAKSVTFSK